jgi:hypothetical protein
MTHREPTRRGCSYEDVRRQKSVRRTPAHRRIPDPQGEETPWRWPRENSARRADAPGGGSEARTVREPRVALRQWSERRSAAPGKPWPIVTRPKASRSSPLSRDARSEAAAISAARVNSRRASQDARRRLSFPPGLEPARRCPRQRHETSEIGDVPGYGCSSRRGEGGPSREAPSGAGPTSAVTGLRASRESDAAIG